MVSILEVSCLLYILTGVCLGQQQVFRVTPSDVHVGEGRTAVINCEVENQAGQVQWTKDGLTLGKTIFMNTWNVLYIYGNAHHHKLHLRDLHFEFGNFYLENSHFSLLKCAESSRCL